MNHGKSPVGVVKLHSEDHIEIEGLGVGSFFLNNLEWTDESRVKIRYRKGGIFLEAIHLEDITKVRKVKRE